MYPRQRALLMKMPAHRGDITAHTDTVLLTMGCTHADAPRMALDEVYEQHRDYGQDGCRHQNAEPLVRARRSRKPDAKRQDERDGNIPRRGAFSNSAGAGAGGNYDW